MKPRFTLGARFSASDLTFLVLWLFIAVVSVWDGYLALLNREHLSLMELNPIGKSLIELNQGGVAYLLLGKILGTVVAGASLLLLYEHNPRRGLIVAALNALFQIWLRMFLSYA